MVAPVLLFLGLAATVADRTAPSPSTFEQISQQAESARAADRLTEAIALYSQAVRLRPSWVAGWWSLSSLYYDQDRFRESEQALRHFIAIAPKPGPAYAFLALCEYELQDYDQALRHFQQWGRRGSPGTSDLIDVAGFHWALLLTRDGQFVQALYLLAAKAGKRGQSPALTEAMGLASLRMKSLPEDYPASSRAAVWLAGKAAFYSAVHDFGPSQYYADQLLRHNTDLANVHLLRGNLFNMWKDSDHAAEEYRRELSEYPQNAAAMVELALIDLRNDQADQALPLAQRAAALGAGDARAHYALGWALLKSGQFPQSARELESAKRSAPDSPPIRFALANAYKALGRAKDAEREQAQFDALRKKQEAQARGHDAEDAAPPPGEAAQ